MKNASPRVQAAASQRWDALDIARGVAVLAMIVYHFSWDLSFLKLIATNIVEVPAWRWFARAIAGSFLLLSGLGLAIAHAQGFRPRAFLRRLAKVGGAALAITLVTFFVFPESYIFFGILHCIAVTGVLALPFLRLHPVWIVLAAVFCLIAPHLFTSPVFDRPWLDWLGLGLIEPVTNDYVPIFPWFGLALIGAALGKWALPRSGTLSLARWRGADPFSRLLIFAGRKSLPIYLIHQIVLLGILYGILQLTGPNPTAEAKPFTAECEVSCSAQNSNPGACSRICSCVVENLRQSDLWQKVLKDELGPDDQTRISRTAQQCLRTRPL